ncbi:hypothetical protein Y1Q_0009276 [Alligator mississippiensis]|uniref:Maestro/Maestro-like HEAT-repeats domain-containing protein n=1 Tax=Alligator mississippiensis TaxID=8496 RepID=A0A151LZF0_ALLMI|nr:hypothetical protein Y1Q_0009276 [Alligator mississippiensis]
METLACAISKGLGERVAADLSEAGTWPLLENPQMHHEGVCQLARALLPLGIITPQFIGQVLKWASSPTENLRVTGTAFISQVMCDPVIEEQKLLKAVLYLLQQQARDTNNLVRQMSARGLGNIMYGAPEQLKKHPKAVVDTLFQASFVPARAEIVEEGMRALTHVFKHLGMDAGPLVQDAAMHIRPFFNHDNDGIVTEYAAPRSARQVAHLLSSLQTLGQDTSQEVQDVAAQVAEAISKSPWGSVLQEEENHGHTLPYITSLLCFGCLRLRSI